MSRIAVALVLPLSLLGLWQYAAASGALSPAYFPAPSLVLEALYGSIVSGSVWAPFAATILRMMQGWLMACLVGICLGGLIGSSQTCRDYINPTLEFLRPFPASAVIPAAILIFGLSNTMAVSVIAFGSLWPVLLGTVHGFSAIEPKLREVGLAIELTPLDYFRKVALPAALPDIFTGMRISLAIALILTVVVEMQAAQPGLGQNILLAQRLFRTPELYAGIVVLALIGLVTSWILDFIETQLPIRRSR
jgi:ABC-type nitrate/sulfonate/bicarbonate transport system permease component